MRILQVHTRYRHRGGEDTVVESERRALTAAGHEVVQHVVENPENPVAAAAGLGLSVWNPVAGSRIRSVADAVAPDVAHVHNTWFMSSPAVLAGLRRAGVPIVLTVHNFRIACANALFTRDDVPCEDCLGGSVLPAVRHRCYRGSAATSAVAAAGIGLHRRLGTWARYVDRFVVLSDFAAGRMVAAGLPADRLVRGANFVDDPGPRPLHPAASRQVLFVGRLAREKGVHVLLDAWRHAAPAGLDLVIAGDGPERARLEAMAPPGVRFTGRLEPDGVRALMAASRALVVPSTWYEGQPLVALEALAAHLPLVLSDIGGLPEVLGGHSAGVLAPPGDVAGWAQALAGLADDRSVERLAAGARARYEAVFTQALAVSRLEAVYRSAAGAAAPSVGVTDANHVPSPPRVSEAHGK